MHESKLVPILDLQVGIKNNLVEYQHYMRINGYVWSVTPVEGEVVHHNPNSIMSSKSCLHDSDSDLDLSRLDRLPRLGGWSRQLCLGYRSAQH